MIVKNEESMLDQSLSSISALADEIIITDTGSSDNTKKIARKFTNKIYDFEWINDFSAARNFTDTKANGDYILRWDADFILRSGMDFLYKLKQSDFLNLDLIYHKWNLEFSANLSPLVSVRNYFFYKKNKFIWKYPIHNLLVPSQSQKTIKSEYFGEVEIDHYKDPIIKKHRYTQTLVAMQNVLKTNPKDPYLLFHYAEDLMHAGCYKKALVVLQNFLDLDTSTPYNNLEKNSIALEKMAICYLSLGNVNAAKSLMNKYALKYQSFPRFVLMYADVTCVLDMLGAEEYYLHFIKIKEKLKQSSYSYDKNRYEFHPYFMLCQIYIHKNDVVSTEKYLSLAYENTISQININKLEKLKTQLQDIKNRANL